eukprot:15430754-Alexandrium_andersonii.AAC.1
MARQLQQLSTRAHDLWANPHPPTHEKRLRRTHVQVTMMNDHSPQARAPPSCERGTVLSAAGLGKGARTLVERGG